LVFAKLKALLSKAVKRPIAAVGHRIELSFDRCCLSPAKSHHRIRERVAPAAQGWRHTIELQRLCGRANTELRGARLLPLGETADHRVCG
jgi:hypothetical protein